uniref:Uncharacterized protein n=1 Tax=Anopheles coluzzii TaxID=1518534 RepID=A0A8W7Q002_ANOCL
MVELDGNTAIDTGGWYGEVIMCQMSRNSRFKLIKSSGTSGRSTSHPTCASSCFQPLRNSCGNPRPKAVLLMPPHASARSCSTSPAIRFSSASCGTFHSVAT